MTVRWNFYCFGTQFWSKVKPHHGNYNDTIVNRGEWLQNPTKFFVVCLCSLFWPRPCTKHNREFKKTTTATVSSLNKRFDEQNNGCARALTLCTFHCRPLQNNNVKWQSSALSEERLRLLFFILNLLRCARFSFTIAFTVINKANDIEYREILW